MADTTIPAAPTALYSFIELTAPEVRWNGDWAAVYLTPSGTAAAIHVMSRDQARALKEAFAEVEAMYAEREEGSGVGNSG